MTPVDSYFKNLMNRIKVVNKNSLFGKTLGLISLDNVTPIYFKTRFGIHTFFVKKPIDVIILDNNYVVKTIKTGLQPFRLYFWNPKYYKVIEAPNGFIKKTGIQVGVRVNLKEV